MSTAARRNLVALIVCAVALLGLIRCSGPASDAGCLGRSSECAAVER